MGVFRRGVRRLFRGGGFRVRRRGLLRPGAIDPVQRVTGEHRAMGGDVAEPEISRRQQPQQQPGDSVVGDGAEQSKIPRCSNSPLTSKYFERRVSESIRAVFLQTACGTLFLNRWL